MHPTPHHELSHECCAGARVMPGVMLLSCDMPPDVKGFVGGVSARVRRINTTVSNLAVRRVDTTNSRLLAVYSKRVACAVAQTVKSRSPAALKISAVALSVNLLPSREITMFWLTFCEPFKVPSGSNVKNVNLLS